MKIFVWHVISAAVLAAFAEFYFWSQSSPASFDSNAAKAFLVCCYLLLAVGSQLLFSWFLRYAVSQAILMNLVLAVLVSIWVTYSAFALHPGLAKGEVLGWPSFAVVFFRFMTTIGLGTFALRLLTFLALRRITPAR